MYNTPKILFIIQTSTYFNLKNKLIKRLDNHLGNEIFNKNIINSRINIVVIVSIGVEKETLRFKFYDQTSIIKSKLQKLYLKYEKSIINIKLK